MFYHFAEWRRRGTWEQINTSLREQHRLAQGRKAQPTAAIIDSQSVRTTEAGDPRGYDGDKKLSGRKRHVLMDTQGNLLKACMHPADIHGRFRTPQGSVLLVEDEFATRMDLRAALEKDGWTVTEADNGRKALQSAAAQRLSMVLLDLSMPVMDGFDFMEELRCTPGCADVPVVILTARELSREDRHRLRDASQILNTGDGNVRSLTERLQRVADIPAV